jgi:hypothetical protein
MLRRRFAKALIEFRNLAFGDRFASRRDLAQASHFFVNEMIRALGYELAISFEERRALVAFVVGGLRLARRRRLRCRFLRRSGRSRADLLNVERFKKLVEIRRRIKLNPSRSRTSLRLTHPETIAAFHAWKR